MNAVLTRASAVRLQARPRRAPARLAVLVLAAVVALTTAGQVSAAPALQLSGARLAMTGGTGTGGAFNPLAARLVDTRSGVGGFSTPVAANTSRSYQVTGVGGVPATGVSSVAVTVTALNPANEGRLSFRQRPRPTRAPS